MTLEGVPWMVGSGAQHSAEVGRLLAYAAVGGAEGVVGPGDFKVTASDTPDGNVNIAAGGLAVLNAFPDGGQQAYLLRNSDTITQAMTPQGAGGTRYDLVCILVEDPQYAGQPNPPDVADGPYVRVAVYEDVSSTTKALSEVDPGQSGYALARVAFSASDGTVTNAEITDLRQLVQPRRKEVTRIISPVGTTALPGSLGTTPVGASWNIDVPEWATRVILEGLWASVQMVDTSSGAGNALGGCRVQLGTLNTQTTLWQADANASNKPVTQVMAAAEDLAVPDAMRGSTQSLTAQMSKTGGSGMTAQCTQYTTATVKATFYEDVE